MKAPQAAEPQEAPLMVMVDKSFKTLVKIELAKRGITLKEAVIQGLIVVLDLDKSEAIPLRRTCSQV